MNREKATDLVHTKSISQMSDHPAFFEKIPIINVMYKSSGTIEYVRF